MAQQINTIIVLRNDDTTAWKDSNYKLLKGEVGLGRLANGNVMAKIGDGEHTWNELKQLEGVIENEITLTHNFGRYTTSNGFVKTTDAAGKTVSEWLVHALSEVQEPIITDPEIGLTVSGTGTNGEIGSYITKLNWEATFADGSYQWGPATGLSANNVTWKITNNITDDESTSKKSSFDLGENKIQLTQETSKTYATVTGVYSLDASNANDPKNNVGETTTGKIASRTDVEITKNITSTAYRKPFWGVLSAGNAIDVNNLTSDIIRGLPKSGTSVGGVPSGTTYLSVPAGSEMVIFAIKAGTKKSLIANDNKALNAEVGFTKVANAVRVKGANNFVPTDASGDALNGELYDIWYVNWNPDNKEGYKGIDAAKELKLTWA